MSVSMVITLAFYGLLVFGYVYAVGKLFRGESEFDGERPPAFWPFSVPLWRGVGRALPVQGLSILVLIGGGITGDLLGEGSSGYDLAMGIGLLGALGNLFLALPIVYFNRPRAFIPPPWRDDPSTVEEWRRERERRSPKSR